MVHIITSDFPQSEEAPFVCDDGGRNSAGYNPKFCDCSCRSISIAADLPYETVYDALVELGVSEKKIKRRRKRSNALADVRTGTVRKYLLRLGWRWVPTMAIGQGCTVHLRYGELPDGKLIVQVSRHFTALVDGALHDIYDCSRHGTRCVYGYYLKSNEVEA